MKKVYLDNASTTAVDKEVFKIMKPYFYKEYGNTFGYHRMAQVSYQAVEQARKTIADFLGAYAEEIIFVGSATESDNLAIKGLIEGNLINFSGKKPHIITSSIEHKAVLESCKHLEKNNLARVTYLSVDSNGLVNIKDVIKTIKEDTILVSLMYVNNEVGAVQKICQLGSLISKLNRTRKKRIYFHTDATQAMQYLNCNVRYLKVDLLSFSGHKLFGPKGIGVLYKKKDLFLIRQSDGGGQEFGFRAGTVNVPNVAGLGKAIELISDNRNDINKVKYLQNTLIKGLLKTPGVTLTGSKLHRIPHIASFIVHGVEGEALVLKLSDKNIFISSGSACNSQDLQPSHVLSAMGFSPDKTHGSIRFSLSKNNTLEEILYVIKVFPKVVEYLRKMSPII